MAKIQSSQPIAYLQLLVNEAIQDDAESFDVRVEDFKERKECFEIYLNCDHYIGRNATLCDYILPNEKTISSKHLCIYSLLFEERSIENIPPLVYAVDLSRNGCFLARGDEVQDLEGSTRSMLRETMMDYQQPIMLLESDIIRISPRLALRFHYLEDYSHIRKCGLPVLQRVESTLFNDKYKLTNRILGTGGQGAVVMAVNQESGRQLACKIVKLRSVAKNPKTRRRTCESVHSEQLGAVQVEKTKQFREFDILRDLSHPNIINLEKVYWSSNTIYIFQELVSGGDLFSYLASRGGHISDKEAVIFLYQVLQAVEYLHSHDIVHRDLKPDNILMSSPNREARLLLSDFGSARRSSSKRELGQLGKGRMFSMVGTLEYVAPEVYGRNRAMSSSTGYSKAADMWSVGVVTTTLLTGDSIFVNRIDPRFETHPDQVIFENANECNLDIMDHSSTWADVDHRAKDFIRELLVLEENKRSTVAEALRHAWFTDPANATSVQSAYDSCTADWKPHPKATPLIEALDLTRLRNSQLTCSQRQSSGASFSLSGHCSAQSSRENTRLLTTDAMPSSEQSPVSSDRGRCSDLPKLDPIEEETQSEIDKFSVDLLLPMEESPSSKAADLQGIFSQSQFYLAASNLDSSKKTSTDLAPETQEQIVPNSIVLVKDSQSDCCTGLDMDRALRAPNSSSEKGQCYEEDSVSLNHPAQSQELPPSRSGDPRHRADTQEQKVRNKKRTMPEEANVYVLGQGFPSQVFASRPQTVDLARLAGAKRVKIKDYSKKHSA